MTVLVNLYYVTLYQEAVVEDVSDEPFTPDIDMSKPWVTVDTEAASPAVEAAKNLSKALANIPADTKEKMGFTIHDMLLECSWNGKSCSPRWV